MEIILIKKPNFRLKIFPEKIIQMVSGSHSEVKELVNCALVKTVTLNICHMILLSVIKI